MKTVITILFVTTSIAVWSQNDSLTIHNNPGVQSKSFAYESTKEKKVRETTLPNLEISAGVFIKPMVLPMGNQVAQFTAMQMFPWFGTYESVRAEAEAMETVTHEQYIATRNNIILQHNVSKLNLYNLKKKKELTEEQLTLLLAIEDYLIARYSSAGKGQGDASSPAMGMASTSPTGTGMSQLLLLRMEIKSLQNQIHVLEDESQLERIRFNVLLNRNKNEPVEIPDTLVLFPSPIPTTDSNFENSPMVKMVEAEKRAAEASEQMAIKMGAPMIGAGVNYMVMQKPTGGDFPMADGKDMVMPMVSLSLPIYRKKYTALKKEAQLNQASLGKQLEQTKNDLMLEYEEALQMKKIAERNLLLALEQIALAENTVTLLLSAYTTNQAGYDEVLRMKSQVLMLRMDAVEALVEHNTAVSKLEHILNTYEAN